ncbi:caspase-like [Harmonia axyridis]|uniref:caspase-like n=1 Tax=Harmonia axyridis TaxID=115357 RepID=UPI001E27662F|nr:caspase-like [Harmonia axyridis]XP_045473673.1 caspase-like [Harmonia axyridis]
MQEKFRHKIKQQFPELVDLIKINPEVLADYLIENGALKESEKEVIFNNESDYKHITRLLLFTVMRKSDRVYDCFMNGLQLFGVIPESTINSRTIPVSNQGSTHKEIIRPSNFYNRVNNNTSRSNVNNNNEKLEVVPATKFTDGDNDEVYYTRSLKRGQVLIINNREFKTRRLRKGSEHDVECLQSLFKQMSFDVTVHTELSINEMKNQIERFKSFDSNKISDICVVFIMSHGKEEKGKTFVLDKSDDGLETFWIEEQFNNVNCETFIGKPKLIFYQMCRGSQHDYASTPATNYGETNLVVTEGSVETDSGHMPEPARRRDDMLIGHSTQQGYRSHRDTLRGTWFIQLLCKVLMEKAHNSNIIELLNEVDRRMKTLMSPDYTVQTPNITLNGFNKKLYFHPGIYEDKDGNIQKFV